MDTKTKTRDRKYGAHQPWKSRFVLWARRDGVDHVATSAASLGRGIVSKVLCGGASTMFPHSSTWYGQKNDQRRCCRKCVALLRDAGANGRLKC